MKERDSEPGTYTGTIDDILDRHDPHIIYTPKSYPKWSDKGWIAIYHLHGKALRIIEDQIEGEKIKERYIARENFIKSLQALSQSKQSRIDAREKYKARCNMLILLKSGDSKGVLRQQKELKEDLSNQADDLLLWFWNLMSVSSKNTKGKSRKGIDGILLEIKPLLEKRGLPLSGEALNISISRIGSDRLRELRDWMGYCS